MLMPHFYLIPVRNVDDNISTSVVEVLGRADDDDDGTVKLLLVRVIPIIIKELISSDTTCRSYVRTAFGCKSVNENIPVVLVTYAHT